MTVLLQQRVVAFSVLIAACLLLVGSAGLTAWRDIGALRQRFTTMQFESFRISEQLQARVLALNSGLLGYDLGGAALDWERFQKNSDALNDWIEKQKGALKTDGERTVLAEIDAEYDRYLAVAKSVHDSPPDRAQATGSRVAQIDEAAHRLFALGSRLADAHRHALGGFLSESQKSLQRLEMLLGAGLVGMIAAFLWGTRVIFRETIAPLRRQVIETRALAERHEKLASLGVLAAGVAHEIRNPLTAIKARVFTLKRGLTAESAEARDAAIIESEILRLERIVRDFLQFARPGDPVFSALTPRVLFDGVRDLVLPQLSTQQIELITLNDSLDTGFQGDLEQLLQVIINLVRNAAESIERHGKITLSARENHRMLAGRIRDVIVIEVRDSGAGIPAAVQERLFDPFFTTKAAGTGLGLSIALRILEKHHGALEYQTESGRGTTFALVLPLDDA